MDARTSRITGRWSTGQLKLEWLAGTWSGDRWLVAANGGGNSSMLLSLEPDSTVAVLGTQVHERPDSIASDSSWIPGVRLSASRDRVLLASVEPPHRVFVSRTDGSPLHSLVPSHDPSTIGQRPSATTMATLATYWLDSGYVQILADLRSDFRELHVFDEAGQWMRSQSFNAPWGPAHANVAQSTLLVLRGINPHEAVFYDWRWAEF